MGLEALEEEERAALEAAMDDWAANRAYYQQGNGPFYRKATDQTPARIAPWSGTLRRLDVGPDELHRITSERRPAAPETGPPYGLT